MLGLGLWLGWGVNRQGPSSSLFCCNAVPHEGPFPSSCYVLCQRGPQKKQETAESPTKNRKLGCVWGGVCLLMMVWCMWCVVAGLSCVWDSWGFWSTLVKENSRFFPSVEKGFIMSCSLPGGLWRAANRGYGVEPHLPRGVVYIGRPAVRLVWHAPGPRGRPQSDSRLP